MQPFGCLLAALLLTLSPAVETPDADTPAETPADDPTLDFDEPPDPNAPLPPGLQERAAVDDEASRRAAALADEDVPEGVDVFDESTWGELSVPEKDRMRAIRQRALIELGDPERARLQAEQAAEDQERAQAITGQREAMEAMGPARRQSRLSEWQQEDARLERMQTGWGVAFALGLGAAIGGAIFGGIRMGQCSRLIVEPTPGKCVAAPTLAIAGGATFAIVTGTGLAIVSAVRRNH